MAEITNPHFDQQYSKYIFRNSMSHNLQRAKKKGDNIKFYWINFITSLLFLWKQFYNPKLKVIIIISSLIHLTIAYNGLSVSFNNVSDIVSLKNSPTNESFTIEVLHITNKSWKQFTQTKKQNQTNTVSFVTTQKVAKKVYNKLIKSL